MIGPPRMLYTEASSDEEDAKPDQTTETEQVNQDQPLADYQSLGIPVESYTVLEGHKKSVTAVDVDPKGYRMVTGSLDYTMRMWDFHGMNKNMNSFRVTEPIEGNSIRNLSYNTTGTHVLVVCGGKQVMMADKDGAKGLLTVKGYMYIKNLHKTKGHTGTIFDGVYHPYNHNEFVTGSADGSVRLWDMEQKLQGIEEQLAHKTLIRCLSASNHPIGITAVSYVNHGKMVFAGCADGSLQGFSTKHHLHRPEMMVRDAHVPNEQFTKIIHYDDGWKLASRNMDGSLKLWDIRKFVKPIVQEFNLPNYFPGSKMCLSPNQNLLLVGTSVSKVKQEQESAILFMNPDTLEVVRKMTVGPYSVTDIKWSKQLNQIVIGTTANNAMIFFDKKLSRRGAVECIQRQPRVEKDYTFGYSMPVYLPHSLPLYQQRPTNNKKKDENKIRKDPILSQKPEYPQQGPWKYGRPNVAFTIIQHVIQSSSANPEKVDDARAQILQIAGYTNKNAQFTQVYRATQPEAIYSDEPHEIKQFELLAKITEICPHCGMKLCTCARKYMIDPSEQ